MVQIKKYREKVDACWLGKAIAGGIGAPYEGVPYPLELTEKDIYIDDSPNDDLELQLLWLLYAEKHGLELNSGHLSDAWLNCIGYGPDEYGVAIWNLKRGLKPPYTGLVDNWFVNGLGATIRAEIWACLFPGKPEAAGYFASQDASVDHHNEGVWGEIYIAAAEAIAFTDSNIRKAFEDGLNYIPADSKIAQVVKYILELYEKKTPYKNLRTLIMDNFGSHSFTDCVMNIGFMVSALLWGENNFIKTVLYAVNFGYDTDCTAATCGAFMGIAHGRKIIPEYLHSKLCQEISVSPFIEKIAEVPETFSEFTERVITLNKKLAKEMPEKRNFPKYEPVDISDLAELPTKNSWLILDDTKSLDIDKVEKNLLKQKKCPENLLENIVEKNSIHLDVSEYASNFNEIHLFSFLTIDEQCNSPLMFACANTGITVWIDGIQVINYHGRQKEIPTFHRTEGGAACYYPFKKTQKYLIHVRLLFCRPPVKFSMAVGDEESQFIKDFKFRI
jgi:ADP-ribosylglycohydrolase